MGPEDLERVQKYNRSSKSEYVSWLLAKVDMPMRPSYLGMRTREDIDLAILSAIKVSPVVETPTWVEAAEEVLNNTEEEEVEEPLVVGDLQPDEPEVIPDQPADNNPFTDFDYDAMTVVELRDICRDRGLTVRGTKAEVVLRLRRDDEGLTQDPVESDEDESEAPVEETAADDSSDAPSEEEAATEEVTNNANSGETSDIEEEE
jgi:hypothetical protein